MDNTEQVKQQNSFALSNIFRSAGALWKQFWWRFGVIYFIEIFILWAVVIVILLLLGGDVKITPDFITDIMLYDDYRALQSSVWFMIFGYILMVVLGIMGQASICLTLRETEKGTPPNPIKVFFLQSIRWVPGIIYIFIRQFLYIFIPALVVFVIAAVAAGLLSATADASFVSVLIRIVMFLAFLSVILAFVYQVVLLTFIVPYYIYSNKKPKEAFIESYRVVRMNFWKVIWVLFVIILCMILWQIIINGLVAVIFGYSFYDGITEEFTLSPPLLIPMGVHVVVSLLSTFIFLPFIITAYWRLMRVSHATLES